MKKYIVTVSSGDGRESSIILNLTHEQLVTALILEECFDKAKNYNEPHLIVEDYKEEQK